MSDQDGVLSVVVDHKKEIQACEEGGGEVNVVVEVEEKKDSPAPLLKKGSLKRRYEGRFELDEELVERLDSALKKDAHAVYSTFNTKGKLVKLEYVFLGLNCGKCGILGHNDRSCEEK